MCHWEVEKRRGGGRGGGRGARVLGTQLTAAAEPVRLACQLEEEGFLTLRSEIMVLFINLPWRHNMVHASSSQNDNSLSPRKTQM